MVLKEKAKREREREREYPTERLSLLIYWSLPFFTCPFCLHLEVAPVLCAYIPQTKETQAADKQRNNKGA